MTPLRVLIACEESGTMRRAFATLGHDAWSCDLAPARDGSNHHIQGDVRDHLHDDWDFMMVAHRAMHGAVQFRGQAPLPGWPQGKRPQSCAVASGTGYMTIAPAVMN